MTTSFLSVFSNINFYIPELCTTHNREPRGNTALFFSTVHSLMGLTYFILRKDNHLFYIQTRKI